MKRIINSLFDFDLYKLTVHQLTFLRFGSLQGKYSFTCRNKDKVDLLKYVPQDELEQQIAYLGTLTPDELEMEWVRLKKFITPAYAAFLSNFRFNPSKEITVVRDEANKTYVIEAAGPLISIILYETLILCIVNEIFERNYTAENSSQEQVEAIGLARLRTKIAKIEAYNEECKASGFEIPELIEFGTRRRYSVAWQEIVLKTLMEKLPNLVGTSNVHLAAKHGLTPIGTFGHEYMMILQGVFPIQHSQKRGLEIWLEEYRGAFGIALSDTLGNDKFDKDFDLLLAKAYDGTRHDSGCPFEYGERRIKHYKMMGIDPKTKKIVFSDGLDVDTMIALHRHFRGRIKMSFGIGTNLTNDVGNPVLQIVMKVVESNGQDVCKLSANPEKACCRSALYLEYAKMAIEKY